MPTGETQQHNAETQHCLYHVFRYEKCAPVEETAESIGVPHSTLQKYIMGQLTCPVSVLKKLFVVTRHPMIKKLLEPDGYTLQLTDTRNAVMHPSIDTHLADVMSGLAELRRRFEASLSDDGRIDHREHRDLCNVLGQVRNEIEDLQARVTAEHERTAKVQVIK